MSKKILNYIDGKFVEPTSGEWLDVFAPATGEVYAKLANSNNADVDAAVAAAKQAYNKSWKKTSSEQRSRILNKIADGIEARLEEFALAESHDQGKTITVAKTVEIPRAVANFRFYAGRILHTEEKSFVLDGAPLGPAVSYTTRHPLGVAGLISPWNMPLYLATWKVAPAIAMGNTCVLKPSEVTPATANLLAEVLSTIAELPTGVVNIVHGDGRNAGQALIEHPDVPLISFTGGTATGKHIAKTCGPLLKRTSLELGGKNATIVFADVDMEELFSKEKGAPVVRASFANQGEICLCGERLLVQKQVYDQFVKRFVEATKALKVGDPSDPTTFCGAIVSKEHCAKIKEYITLATEKEGGKLECGGVALPAGLPEKFKNGYWCQPTVLTGLKHDCRCNTEEVFGPFVSIIPFDTEEEAIEITNGTQYGLSCSVWSQNIKTCQRVSSQIDVGTCWINCWLVRDLRAPFGGSKASGIGREGGDYSVDFYSEVKTTCSKY